MAYPTISAPYGFKPVNLQGGRVYSGSTRMIPISSGYGSNLFNGDIVALSGGTLATMATGYNAGGNQTATAGQIGVFVGAEYTLSSSAGVSVGPIYGKNRFQYWPATTYAQDAVGYVVDDPLAYFRVAVLTQAQAGISNTPGATIGYMSPAFLGTNAYIVTGNTGSTATGDSAMGVTGTVPTVSSSVQGNVRYTTTTPMRIIQLVPDTAVTVSTTLSSTPSGAASFSVSSATGLSPGMQCIIPSNTGTSGSLTGNFLYVTAVVGTTVYVATASGGTANITATSGATVSFIGYPEVIVGWNFGYQAYNVAAGV
jgi:hypothetical protein